MKEMLHVTQCRYLRTNKNGKKEWVHLCYYACLESILRDMGETQYDQKELFRLGGECSNLLESYCALDKQLPLNIEAHPDKNNNEKNLCTKDILTNNPGSDIILVLAKKEDLSHLPLSWVSHAVRAKMVNGKALVMDPYVTKDNNGEVFNKRPRRRNDCLLERDFSTLNQIRKYKKDGLREYFLLKRK